MSYVQLYDAVRKEADRRSALNEPPILTSDELLQIARSNPDNDIYDADELNQGRFFWVRQIKKWKKMNVRC